MKVQANCNNLVGLVCSSFSAICQQIIELYVDCMISI
jgi:hypothetical protein